MVLFTSSTDSKKKKKVLDRLEIRSLGQVSWILLYRVHCSGEGLIQISVLE